MVTLVKHIITLPFGCVKCYRIFLYPFGCVYDIMHFEKEVETKMTETTNTIAEKMKLYRKLRGMTAEELSNASGIDYSQIRRYEAGQRNPKFEQLQSIATALGVGVTEFIDFKMNIAGEIVSLLSKLDEQACIQWSGKKDKNGDYIPSSIKISFDDDSINEAIAAYMKYRDNSRQSLSSDYIITDEEGNQLTVEQFRAKSIINDTKIKKPEE